MDIYLSVQCFIWQLEQLQQDPARAADPVKKYIKEKY